MNDSAVIYKTAWLPLTPRGVAAFARASGGRLFLVQFVVAALACGVTAWFLHSHVLPTMRAAIASLPDQSQIADGVLVWPTNAPEPVLLAEGRVLSLAVDLNHTGAITTSSDLRIQLGRTGWQAASFYGVLDAPTLVNTTYPPGYQIAINRADLLPWWGAREPYLLALAVVGLGVYLFVSWWVLSVCYTPLVLLGAFYGNRAVTIAGAWRLSGAALLPGALFLTAAILFYGLGAFDALRLALAAGMHVLVGWVYLVAGVLALPRLEAILEPGANPFNAPPGE